ncbi:hypothetical protein [Microbacterium sp. 22296]|uniref:hypothetical protein n=1 Tax=Microbacterium sp. 22296 TaxID=3453903 RepID=UPI003F8535D0
MPHTISASNNAGSVTPTLIDGYKPSRQSRNKIHDLLDGSIGVSYIAPRPRSGTLRLLFLTAATANAAYALHAQETSFTLTSTDVPSMGMRYVLDGSLDIELNPQLGHWWVLVGYQELSA